MIALDLDGTLTNSKKEVTEQTKEVIKKVIAQGISVVLASGRPRIGIQPVADRLELSKWGGYIIAYNGGQIFDCKQNQVLFQSLLPRQYYSELCQWARQYQVQPLTYNTTSVVAESDQDRYVKQEAYNNSVSIQKVENLEEYVSYPVVKFMIVGEPEKLNPLYLKLKENYRGKLGVFFSEPYFLEIVSLGIEKAKALKWLLNHLGLKRENLIAFGDGLNDIPMLEFAGYAVAMENACQEVKEKADYITLSNDREGVAKAIKDFILEKKIEDRKKIWL